MKEPYLVLPYTENARRLIVNRFLPLAGRAGSRSRTGAAERLRRLPLRRLPQPPPQGDQGGSRPREQAASQGQGRPPAHGQGEPGVGLQAVHRVHQREGWGRLPQDQVGQEVQPHLRAHQGRDSSRSPRTPSPLTTFGTSQFPSKIRDYQREAWEEFLRFGAIGAFWPPGAGKSLFCVWACAKLEGQEARRHEEQLDHSSSSRTTLPSTASRAGSGPRWT